MTWTVLSCTGAYSWHGTDNASSGSFVRYIWNVINLHNSTFRKALKLPFLNQLFNYYLPIKFIENTSLPQHTSCLAITGLMVIHQQQLLKYSHVKEANTTDHSCNLWFNSSAGPHTRKRILKIFSNFVCLTEISVQRHISIKSILSHYTNNSKQHQDKTW